MKRSGRLAFACWREPRENPFFMAPLQAVYKHAPRLPPQGPEDPGPFAFASEARVQRILAEAGFTGIAMEPCDLSLDIAIGRGLDAAVQERARHRTGRPRARRPAAGSGRRRHANSMREALAPFLRGATVPLPAAIWIVTARAGAATLYLGVGGVRPIPYGAWGCFRSFISAPPAEEL